MLPWNVAIFDKDGTLVDTLTVSYFAVREIFKTFRPDIAPPTLKQYREEIGADFKRFYYKYGIPPEITPDEMNVVRSRVFKEHAESIKPYRGMKELLNLCHTFGMKIAVVSASPEDLEKEFAEWDVLHLISRIRNRAYCKTETLAETVDYFGFRTENAFYLDDTFDGLMSAKNVGITPIGISHGFNSREKIMEATHIIADSLYDVMKIVQKGAQER